MKVILVLSCPTVDNGYPEGMILGRLKKAFEEWLKDPDQIIIASGGNGGHRPRPSSTIMKEYLVSRGVPSHQVLEEPKALNTVHNFVYSGRLIRLINFCRGRIRHGDQLMCCGKVEQVVIVTSDFHIERCKHIIATHSRVGVLLSASWVGTHEFHSVSELSYHVEKEKRYALTRRL